VAKVVDIMNLTGAELTDVNAGGTDIPAYTRVDSVTLTDTELGTLLDSNKVALIKSTCDAQEHHAAGVMMDDREPYLRNALAV
jgi:hypothetical protein